MHCAGVTQTKRTPLLSLIATLLVLAVGACSDSVTGVEATTAELLGTWNITSLTFAPAGGGNSVEGLAGSATITFEANLNYTLTFTEGQVQDIETGTFNVSGTTLTLTITGEDPDEFTVTALSSSGATLYSADESFDFNGDDVETDATLTVTLQR